MEPLPHAVLAELDAADAFVMLEPSVPHVAAAQLGTVAEVDLELPAGEKSVGIAVVPAAQAQLETRQVVPLALAVQKLLLVRQSLLVQWNHPHQKESEVRHYAMDVFVR